jgi:hypothetical protein
MKHNPKDLAIKIIFGFAKDKVPADVGLAALAMALIIGAKERGFTDEGMVEIFKTNLEQINKDMNKQ